MDKKAKKFSGFDGLVFSTNPDQQLGRTEDIEQDTLSAKKQQLRVQLDKRQRGGKAVTLITGFIGSSDDLKQLGKMLKTKCGVGGTVKDDEILIQGDFRTKILALLIENGYNAKQIGG